jgi:hypothetical protein
MRDVRRADSKSVRQLFACMTAGSETPDLIGLFGGELAWVIERTGKSCQKVVHVLALRSWTKVIGIHAQLVVARVLHKGRCLSMKELVGDSVSEPLLPVNLDGSVAIAVPASPPLPAVARTRHANASHKFAQFW